MNKTILEQALDHLLNKEDAKASALLHDYYVGIGRKVYEDIMTDDTEFGDEFGTQRDMLDVEEDLTEIGGDDEFADAEAPADDEFADAEDDLGADMGMDDGAGDEPAGEASDVADAMLDVESALAQLKAEFEEMVSGEEGGEEFAADDELAADDEFAGGEEEPPMEGLEESLDLQAVPKQSNEEGRAVGAGTGYANGVTGETNKRSPVAGKNPMMARPATNFAGGAAQGQVSGTRPATAPKSQDQGYTTKPSMKPVPKPGTAPGREQGSSKQSLPRA